VFENFEYKLQVVLRIVQEFVLGAKKLIKRKLEKLTGSLFYERYQ